MQGKQSNTLKIRMKMNRKNCISQVNKKYKNGSCTFDVNTNSTTNISPLSLTVIKTAIVAKTTNNKSNVDNIIKGILENNMQQFKVLKEYGYVPDTKEECEEFNTEGKCKLDNLGHPKVKLKYKKIPKAKYSVFLARSQNQRNMHFKEKVR